MNNPQNLDIVLDKLYAIAKDATLSKRDDFAITCYSQAPENLEGYIEALEFLKKNKVIETYKKYSQGEENVEIELDENNTDRGTLYFLKLDCKLKPKILIDFMIETSRLPKYTLTLGDKRRLLLNGRHILSTLHFDSPNFYFIDYAMKHPGEIIKRVHIEKTAGKMNKRFHTILEQVIKSSDLRRVFFPNVSESAAEFRNEVMMKDVIGEKIDDQKIITFLKNQREIIHK